MGESWRLVLAASTFVAAMLSFQTTAVAQAIDLSWLPFSQPDAPHGRYGERGVADRLNMPGHREGAVTWRGLDGRIWLFGGLGVGEEGDPGFLDDLWAYDVASNMWTWMAGSSGNAQVVRTRNDLDPSRRVPAARLGAVGWTSPSGDLWLAGGAGPDVQSEDSHSGGLWRFDPFLESWTRASHAELLKSVEQSLLSVQGLLWDVDIETLRAHLATARQAIERNDVLTALGGLVRFRTELPGEPMSFRERFVAPMRMATDAAISGLSFTPADVGSPQVDVAEAALAGAMVESRPLLEGNFPNPFSGPTTIRFRLDDSEEVHLVVYDIIGREVITLRSGIMPEGMHDVVWDGRDAAGTAVPSGVYLYRIRTATRDRSRVMTLVR